MCATILSKKRSVFIALFLCVLGVPVWIHAQSINYTVCNQCWLSDSLGNHRAVVKFNGAGNVAHALIEWRRRDTDPQLKRIIVQDSATSKLIEHVLVLKNSREEGDILFEPISGKGIYYVYYMPYKNEGRNNYPKGVYPRPLTTENSSWLKQARADIYPENSVCREIQSIDAFNSFYPMEVIATDHETAKLVNAHKGKSFIVFTEDRDHPVKMVKDLPQRWIQEGPMQNFKGKADKGEYYAFQIAIYALKDLQKVTVNFTDLLSSDGKKIPASAINCINTQGIGYDAKPFTKELNITAHTIQPLWVGVDVPSKAITGMYHAKALIHTADGTAQTIALTLSVTNNVKPDGGENEPAKQTRLKWLNSTLAQDNTVIAPYTALQLKNHSISLLGRNLELNTDGFPKQIQTMFTEEMTGYSQTPNNLLAAPLHFEFIKREGEELEWSHSDTKFTKVTAGTIQWNTVNHNEYLQMDVSASAEFDGFLAYTVKVIALKDVSLQDINMQIPFQSDLAKYMFGLGEKGSYLKAPFSWKWDVQHKNQDGAWIGTVNAGMQYSLRDEHYVRPLNTNFYLQKPLLLPTSWGNDNKGGVNINPVGNTVLVNNYSGQHDLKKGDVLYFNFNLLITPFHPINTDFQWETKFYHQYNSIDSIKRTGATVINIHHATPINPWINYPFIEWKKMKDYIDEAHAKGLKVKIYNTVRELSNHAYELPALRSLGHEVYSAGKGGGFSWLQEHVGDDYIAAWFVPEIKDAALVNSGMNRWHNYYVEGMNWLVKNVGIDGIYLDDVAFDRITMKRIKRVLTANGHPGIIDLHSANQYNKSDGFNNSANLYLEHFPYLNRLWFGEYFDYEHNSPDFFLTEVSGIPFGLMGEMLEGGGNPWRGMVYGMTNRMPWSDGADPRPIWKLWEDFGMKGSSMIGYWSSNCPVRTDHPNVLATVYAKPHQALVSIASWEDSTVNIKLLIDWKKLGIDQSKAIISVPAIYRMQDKKTLTLNDQISIDKHKGLILWITEQPQ